MKVIGIDPGYDRLGVAVIEGDGGANDTLHYSTCVTTDRSADLPTRLLALGETFATIVATHQPDAVALETLFFNKNQKTAIGVAQARGLLLYLAKRAGATVYEFGPQEVKVAVTGYGGSDKRAVFEMVRRLLPSAPAGALDDEYDAIAVGITCLAHHGRGR